MRNPTLRGENTGKVGYTTRHVKKRLSDANSETYSLPEWEVELAKEVDDVVDAEKKVHKLLELHGMRMNPRREFFQVPSAIIKAIFDLIPGQYYTIDDTLPSDPITPVTDTEEEIEDTEEDTEIVEEHNGEAVPVRATAKDMRDYLNDGTRLRHRLLNGDEWFGTYNRDTNTIDRGDSHYPTPSAFADAHSVEVLQAQRGKRSGWSECFAELPNGEWKYLRKLEIL